MLTKETPPETTSTPESAEKTSEATGQGVFDDLALAGQEKPDAQEQTTETPETVKAEETTDEIPEKKEPEIEEVKKEEPERVYAERFKKVEDLEVAYKTSSEEGRRLKQELTKTQGYARNYQAIIAKLQSEIKTAVLEKEIGAFSEIPREALLAMMSSEDPEDRLKASEYLTDKKEWDRKKEQVKEISERNRRESESLQAQTRDSIDKNLAFILTNPTNYPDAEKLIPVMDKLVDQTNEEISGYAWAPEILYLAALGQQYLAINKEANIEKKKNDAAAAGKAKAAASAAGGTGPMAGMSISAKKDQEMTDEEYSEAIIRARPSSPF